MCTKNIPKSQTIMLFHKKIMKLKEKRGGGSISSFTPERFDTNCRKGSYVGTINESEITSLN